MIALLRVSQLNLHKSENLPLPLFTKEGNTPLNPLLIEGNFSSLWQREVRRDFINNVVIIMRPLICNGGHSGEKAC
jgi:hypothetical protein